MPHVVVCVRHTIRSPCADKSVCGVEDETPQTNRVVIVLIEGLIGAIVEIYFRTHLSAFALNMRIAITDHDP